MCLKKGPSPSSAPVEIEQTIEPSTDHNFFVMNTDDAEDSCPISWSKCDTESFKRMCKLPGTRLCCSKFNDEDSSNTSFACFCTEDYEGRFCEYMTFDESRSGGMTPDLLLILIFVFILVIIITSLVITCIICRRRRWQQTHSRTQTSGTVANGCRNGSRPLKGEKPRSSA